MERQNALYNRDGSSESISLNAWVGSFHDEEEMQEIFLNMDRAMKYIHDRGYCIKSFDPGNIEILNNSVNQIRFSELLKMPSDYTQKKRIVKEDIYNSAFIQIGLYTKCLNYLNRDFLKSNFDGFATFLPESDVPYYRGVVERGASVYLSEFVTERTNRELAALEKELNGGSDKSVVPMKKIDDSGINDKINDAIYKQISGRKGDAAFVSALIFPTIILAIGLVFALAAWFISAG